MTSMNGCIVAVGVAAVIGCSSGGLGSSLRFKNQPPVWQVNDRKDVPKKPANRGYARTLYQMDGYVFQRLFRQLDVPDPVRALNVNSMDEVPDSTWFTNRIGVREVSLEEMRRGPNRDAGPEPHKPWTITGTKVGGKSIGFLMKDAKGTKYLLKFDHELHPEMETGADIVVQKILYAAGYNAPEDTVVHFRRADLLVAKDAVKKDTFGNKTPMSVKDLEDGLARVYKSADGVYRALTSKYLPGIPIGGYPRGGVRADDPNDLIPHEKRRELRGQVSIFAWLNHTDLQEDNTLDVWEADPDDPNKHYVKHYLIDFGKALGVMAFLNRRPAVGYAHLFDMSAAFKSIFALGFWKKPWEGQSSPLLRGVGVLDYKRYDPGQWKSNSPYWPFKDADRFDAFWGAKILIRFTRPQLRVAVEEAKYSDPRATQYIVDALVARQRKTARYWFERVNPLDAFSLTASRGAYQLCFDDLMIKYKLKNVQARTRYHVRGFDYDGAPTQLKATVRPSELGRACVDGIASGPTHDGYVIVRIATDRGRRLGRGQPRHGVVLVHMAQDSRTRALRVIGLRRM